MADSYKIINYSLRPAKYTERKMLCEAFSRLKIFGPLESYRYIGFGSLWFSDCSLFHRSLGIKDMISIEKATYDEARFEFNRPYRHINIDMRETASVLPSLDWDQRTILWLDYDDPLNTYILDDVRTCASRIQSGSVLAISVNAVQLYDKRDIHENPLAITKPEQFSNYFGSERTPDDLTHKDLRRGNLSRTIRRIIRSEIQNALDIANATKNDEERLTFKQIASIDYSDNANITTIIGVFVSEKESIKFEGCNFPELPFYSDTMDAFMIVVPILTPREMRYLDQHLQLDSGTFDELGPIPEKQAMSYAKLYRYLPNYSSFDP